MNKRGKTILFISVAFLVLLGLFLVLGQEDLTSTVTHSFVALMADGSYATYGVTNYTASNASGVSGQNDTIHFNVTMPSFSISGDPQNVTMVSILTPSNVILNFLYASEGDTLYDNASWGVITYDGDAIGNVTGTVGDWSCNHTDGVTFNFSIGNWTCTNGTDSQLGPSDIIEIWFNYTANTTATEEAVNWDITVAREFGDVSNESNITVYSTNIDGLAPRIDNINITDGNTTLLNVTQGNMSAMGFNALDNTQALTVEATITDANLQSVQMYYLCNASSENITVVDGNNDTYSDINPESGYYSNVTMTLTPSSTTSVAGQNYLATGTIAQACLIDGNTTAFQLVAYDKMGHAFALIENWTVDINSTLLKIGNVNISDGEFTRTMPSTAQTAYLRPKVLTIQVEILGEGRVGAGAEDYGHVKVLWNETGAITKGVNGVELTFDNVTNVTVMENITYADIDITSATSNATIYNVSIDLAPGNESNSTLDAQTFTFYITANSTNDYVAVAGPFSVVLDNSGPSTPLMTAPTDKSIDISDSISYKCESSDAGSGIGEWTWTLVKPDGSTVSYVGGSDTIMTKAFPGTDINMAGTYSVKCSAKDNLGMTSDIVETTSSEAFTAIYSTTAGVAAPTGAPRYDVDFSQVVDEVPVTEGTISASQGVIKTFSFDGVTEHKVTFKEVTETTVTLEIESEPVLVTLSIGETKKVDLNGDGVDDLEVMLNSITDGVAEIKLVELEEGAALIKEEERPKVTPPEEVITEVTPPVEKKPGRAWVWIVVLVAIAVVAVGYYLKKKKKK